MFKSGCNRTSQGLLIPIAVSTAGSAVVLLLMLSLCSFIAISVDLAPSVITPLATTSMAIATFVSAVIFSGLFGKNGLLIGAAIGAGTFALIFVIALIYGLTSFTGTGVVKFILLTLSGAIGGYCGIMLKERMARLKHRK